MSIPESSTLLNELKALDQWVLWKHELREGKRTKIPYSPKGLGPSSTTNRDTWASYDSASLACRAKYCDGVGFVFTRDDPFTGVDLDHCRNPETGEIEAWAMEIMKFLNSYAEITPSNTGIHIIIKAKLPPGGNRKGSIELYDSGRYFTITENHLEGTPASIEERQAEIDTIHTKLFPPRAEVKPKAASNPTSFDDAELLKKAFSAANGARFKALWNGDTSAHNGDDSAADLALCQHLAFWTGNDTPRIDSLFRQSGLMREKWERVDYRERTITKAIENTPTSYCGNTSILYKEYIERDKGGLGTNGTENGTRNGTRNVETGQTLSEKVETWVSDSAGWWQTEELDHDLGIKSEKDKDNRRKILLRLEKVGVIERRPGRNKEWRFVNKQLVELNYKALPTVDPLPVILPLDLSSKVKVFPGNLTVIAGTTNSGKTATALEFVKLNNDGAMPVYFWFSEGGDTELRNRLDGCPGMDISEWNFKAFSRTTDFHDVIAPDCINVIDYLEMTDNFWQINEKLSAICGRIGKGLAVVCIQKGEATSKYGRGGAFSAEKARLYLTLDEADGQNLCRAKIVKAKSWAVKNLNPNGMIATFRVNNGWIEGLVEDWHFEAR